MTGFLGPRATPGVEVVDQGVYRRTVEIDGVAGAIAVRPVADAPRLLLEVTLDRRTRVDQVVDRARRMFDLGADPLRVTSDLGRSPRLRPLIAARPGLRLPGAWDPFELAVRAVLGQQVTVRGATTLAGRLVQTFGRRIELAEAGLSRLFPRAEVLADADLSVIGLPRARAETVRALARAVSSGALALDAARGLDDAVTHLRTIPGVGAWTAHYVAMRALGQPDAWPVSDLGLRRALGRRGTMASAADVSRLGERWRPWRAYAAIWLWTGRSGPQGG